MTDEIPLGSMSSHEEPRSRAAPRPRGPGWRRLEPPIAVDAFLADTWVPVTVDEVNDETKEIRIRWPPGNSTALGDAPHQLLDASHYRLPPAGFS